MYDLVPPLRGSGSFLTLTPGLRRWARLFRASGARSCKTCSASSQHRVADSSASQKDHRAGHNLQCSASEWRGLVCRANALHQHGGGNILGIFRLALGTPSAPAGSLKMTGVRESRLRAVARNDTGRVPAAAGIHACSTLSNEHSNDVRSCAAPTGLSSFSTLTQGLRRWARLFRASGARSCKT
jgi:hypothetical protein